MRNFLHPSFAKKSGNDIYLCLTICPRSLVQFLYHTYYVKMDRASWTYSIIYLSGSSTQRRVRTDNFSACGYITFVTHNEFFKDIHVRLSILTHFRSVEARTSTKRTRPCGVRTAVTTSRTWRSFPCPRSTPYPRIRSRNIDIFT